MKTTEVTTMATMEDLTKVLNVQVRAIEDTAIAAKLKTTPEEARALLEEAVREGIAAKTKKGKYALPQLVGLIYCKAVAGGSFLFARPVDEEVGSALNGDIRLDMKEERAWPDDMVVVRLTDSSERPRATLEYIAKRSRAVMSAQLIVPPEDVRKPAPARVRRKIHHPRVEPEIVAMPEDPRISEPIRISGDLMGARNGDMVLVRIERYPDAMRQAQGVITEVIGDSADIRVIMRTMAASHGFREGFSQEAENEAAAILESIDPKELEGRRDLRDIVLFTIDGEDAQDFDDAVSLEKNEDGTWHLGVHIADVSHYVLPDSPIDREAFGRTTSVYFPGLTFPMLPEKLCNNVCSLMPELERLALSCIMDIRGTAVERYEIVPSVIRSRARLVYTDVNAMFAGKENNVPEDLRETLLAMRELAADLRRARTKRGAIEFELPEPEFRLNKKGEPIGVSARKRDDAEELIEDFMLLANETAAGFAREAEVPIPYRVHEPPDPDTMAELARYLESLEIPARLNGSLHPSVLRDLLESVKGRGEEASVNTMVLRSMRKAEYGAMPHGHFALAVRDYCHFTSPIRRYPDLTVHRQIKAYLRGECSAERLNADTTAMPVLCAHCSQGEYAAVTAEREADDRMRARYMAHHIGELFEGRVSGLTKSSVFVALPNTAEGRVPVWTMDEPYEYSEEMRCLIGEYTGRYLHIGDAVSVRVHEVEEAAGQIEFRIWEIY